MIERISFHDASGAERTSFRTGEELEIRATVRTPVPITRPIFSFGISDGRPGNLILCSMLVDGHGPEVLEGLQTIVCRIHDLPLLPRVYQTWCSVRNGHAYGDLFDWQLVGAFRIAGDTNGAQGPAAVSHLGTDAPIHVAHEWRW